MKRVSFGSRSILFGVTLAMGLSFAIGAQGAQTLLVPAYFYPTGNSYWDILAQAATSVDTVAVVNPSSGSGSRIDNNYVNAVNNLQAAGGRVIGYIYTNYGKRPLKKVEREIKNYVSWYDVDGIFVDEMSNSTDKKTLRYYRKLRDMIKGLVPGGLIVGNPGTHTDETYLLEGMADTLVVFENHSGYDSYTPSPWNYSYSANSFAHLVYGQGQSLSLSAIVGQSQEKNAGLIYVTDDTLPNPWDKLPSYFNDLIKLLAAPETAIPQQL